MADHPTAWTVTGQTAIAVSGVLSAEQYVDGRDLIERGALDGAIHVVGAGWTLGLAYAIAAVVFLAVTPLLEAVLLRFAPSARTARWAPFVVLVGLAVAAGLLAGEWTGRDTLTLLLLVLAEAVRSGVIHAARRR